MKLTAYQKEQLEKERLRMLRMETRPIISINTIDLLLALDQVSDRK